MNPIEYKITLDCRRAESQVIITAKQGEASGRKITFSLNEGRLPYKVPSGVTAVLRAKKPSGAVLYNTCTVTPDGNVEYIITTQTVAEVGKLPCELQLSQDGKVIFSPNFTLLVYKNLSVDSEVESSDEFTALQAAISRAESLTDGTTFTPSVSEDGVLSWTNDGGKPNPEPVNIKGEDGAFRVNVTSSNGKYSADKTFDEIKAAYDAGKQPYVVLTGGTLDLVYTLASFSVPDGTGHDFVDFKRYLIWEDTLETETLRIYSYTTDSGSNIENRISAFNVPSGTTYVKVSSTGGVISTVNGETYADIQALINAGKLVVVRYDDVLDFYYFETFGFSDSSGIHRRLNFRCDMGGSVYTLTLRDDNTWVFSETSLQSESITDVIDTAKYGITAADYVAPFTAAMYEVAYKNGVGIQNAINDAKAKGMERITLPAGNYPLCYHANAKDEHNVIINACGIDIEAYGCKFYVIYDEEGINPYYSWTAEELAENGGIKNSYILMGIVFKTDSNISGANIVGERAYRKHKNTGYRDESMGILIDTWANHNRIADCEIHHFSGDGIGNGIAFENVYISGEVACPSGKMVDGVTEESTDSWLSPRLGIGHSVDVTKSIQIASTGYNYFLWSKKPLSVHCFTQDETYITTVQVKQGVPFNVPLNTFYVYVELYSGSTLTAASSVTINFRFGNIYYFGTVIENCKIYLNQRGGISNLPSGSVVKNCDIHNNGGAYGDMVAYYDSTQFGIDIEDWYADDITIEDCFLYGQQFDVLFRCNKMFIKDSILYDTVKSMNYAVDTYFENSKFYNTVLFVDSAEFGNKTAVGCTFGGAIPDSLLVLDNHALASAELVGGNMVMRNTAGDTICTVDMNKVVPAELVSDGLCMHFDFSVTPANPMQPVDLVNGLPIYNDDYTAANYSEAGVELVNGARANAFMSASLGVTNHFNYAQIPEYATLAAMLRAGTGFTVECFSNQPIPHVLYGHNKGIEIRGNYERITLPYLNSAGVSTSGSSTSVSTFVDDAGNVYNIETAAGQEVMGLAKGYHMVFTADESGTLKVYLNGFTGTGTVTCADFAGWDYDTILAPLYWMFCNDSTYDAQNPKTVKKLRMYNRALSIDEVRNNYRYELNYTPATSLAAATSNTLGGVKADPATEADTQPVRIGTDGKLYTAEGGGGGINITGATVGQIAKITAVDASGAPTAWAPVDMPAGVPSVTAADNGKFLRVVSGAWAAAAINDANGVSF